MYRTWQLPMVKRYWLYLSQCIYLSQLQNRRANSLSEATQHTKVAGGGTVIACMRILPVSQEMAQRVADIIQARLPDIEGHENMEVKVCS